MSLTHDDYLQIRTIVEEVVTAKIDPLSAEVAALRSDVKEIYDMMACQNRDIQFIAQQTRIMLPR